MKKINVWPISLSRHDSWLARSTSVCLLRENFFALRLTRSIWFSASWRMISTKRRLLAYKSKLINYVEKMYIHFHLNLSSSKIQRKLDVFLSEEIYIVFFVKHNDAYLFDHFICVNVSQMLLEFSSNQPNTVHFLQQKRLNWTTWISHASHLWGFWTSIVMS